MRIALPLPLLCAALAATPALAAPSAADCDVADFQTVLVPARTTTGPAGTDTPAVAIHEARAHWLDRRRVQWPGVEPAAGDAFRLHFAAQGGMDVRADERVAGADRTFELSHAREDVPPALAAKFRHVAAGVVLNVAAEDADLRELHRGQLVMTHEREGRVVRATAVQPAGALDDLYAAAAEPLALGATIRRARAGTVDAGAVAPAADGGATRFTLWAPTARSVGLCLYAADEGRATGFAPLRLDPRTGAWSAELRGELSRTYYRYVVDVHVRGTGFVRNRVTDPWSLGLGADSRRSVVVDLDAPDLKPPGWDAAKRPDRVAAPTDLVIYELHVRDFSRDDATVPPALRGKYLAFTRPDTVGSRSLRELSAAGVTDVHLLPTYDLATVPERGCVEPDVAGRGGPADEVRQALVAAVAARDCFNWGYDPFHYTVPEGSYATDASDGVTRIREFRAMVQALHRTGLRVGLDVVYNHTMAAGQDPQSVLDRVVPDYYHRLDALGRVERSTCCANTATENALMAKLMIDSAVVWARDYRIDSFRFDLMGHQPREAMERLQARVDAATGRRIHLIGEGWNFGEVADGARFVQASQLSLPGSGIATFSDRARDAVRGGGAGDRGAALVQRQGWATGLHYDPNDESPTEDSRAALLRAADLVRVGLAGTLRDYVMEDARGRRVPLSALDYAGQPAGYVAEPGEVVNYVENHDNHTLFDAGVLKLPLATSREDRARAQIVALATVAFSQGIAYFHAGGELLRSKSLDRNSYDSGDGFNRLDWTGADVGYAAGLPPERENGGDWPWLRPRLERAGIAPTRAEVEWTRAAFLDLLRIRSSSTLFRLRTAADVRERLRLLDTGPDQAGALVAGHLDGDAYPGAGFGEMVYLINADRVPREVDAPGLRGRPYRLHPVHTGAGAGDRRAREATWSQAEARFRVPPRTAVVFVGTPRAASR